MYFSPIIPDATANLPPICRVPSFAFPLYRDYRIAFPGQRYFEERLSAFNPDLIHIHTPCSLGYAAMKYGQRHGIPVVATYHTHFLSYAKYYGVQALQAVTWNYFRKLYNSCEQVYIPSLPILNELSEHGLTKLEYLPHGVDPDTFQPQFRSPEWKRRLGIEGKTVLLFVGRLVWEKDVRTLAAACRILESKRDDVAVVIVGDGPVRSELEQLMPGAKFLGIQSGYDLSTSYASSDILVFPSTTETFGNVILEAMASGIVPVCAREGGASGVVEHGVTGLLAEPRDAEDLARKITHLLEHAERRKQMAEQALSFASRQTWDNVLAQLVQSYQDTVDNFTWQPAGKQKKAA
jgi:glycosyltransferase involved in cell wall biosynthesis